MMIALSGIDGAGKTTIANKLVAHLTEIGLPAVYSRPRYKVCKQLEFHLLQMTGSATSFDRYPEANLYVNGLMIDWLTHLSDFLLRNEENVIISDRYVLDVFAQSLHIGGTTENFVWFRRQMPAPDLELFLDVEPQIAIGRMLPRPVKLRKFEQIEQLAALQVIYENLISRRFPEVIRIPNLDATLTVDRITEAIQARNWRHRASRRLKEMETAAPICSCCGNYLYP